MYRLLLKKALFLTLLLVNTSFLFAQEVEMADGMRSSGKIYVVVAVLAIILTGIFLFLVNIDRKISRLEKDRK